MSSRWLLDNGATGSAETVGGKALGLLRLVDLGLSVPDFVVLTTDAYRAAVADAGGIPATLPPSVEAELSVAWNTLGADTHPLAVRSSAVAEDAAGLSYAGQMQTVLNVRSRKQLSAAVLECWRSLHSVRAAAYRKHAEESEIASRGEGRGEGRGEAEAMAVVIQHLVRPDAAGVLFTVNPASGRVDEILVTAVWGLGEGLVSGALDADTFVLGRDGEIQSMELAEKTEQFVCTDDGGTARVPVPREHQRSPAMLPGHLKRLAQDALAAALREGRPLDIEFARCGDRVFFLQARPVTAFRPAAAAADGNHQVWDNANIVESYPGITLPLTFSFIRVAYRAVYVQFCELLGLSRRAIRDHDDMFDHMLGCLHGRVYYNLLNWYRLVSLLPGFQWNKRFMEGMMGLREGVSSESEDLSFARRYLLELPKVLWVGVHAVWLHFRLDGMIRRFHRDFDAVYARWRDTDFDALTPTACLDAFADLEEKILWRWKAPIVNDFAAMIFYGVLRGITGTWGVDPSGGIHNELISAQGDIESTRVSEALIDLARTISWDEELCDRILDSTPQQALDIIRRHPRTGAALEEYLRVYGDRCIAELKLESRSMRDDPRFCIAMVQNYLRQPDVLDRQTANPASRNREEALKRVRRHLGMKLTRFGAPKLPIYLWVLKNAGKAVRNRENQRLARTRAFALVRRIFRSIGRTWSSQRILEHADDVFYLELAEIRSFVSGASTLTDLRGLVALRKRQYELYREEPPYPDHVETYGDVYVGNVFGGSEPRAENGKALRGLGAFPGVVEKEAVVLFEPDMTVRLNGEILVTRQTDPGWVVLFPGISGLVVERGSMLSHSAIVAREMGIPAVVGVSGAASMIRSGDRLRLDGASGTVEILERGTE